PTKVDKTALVGGREGPAFTQAAKVGLSATTNLLASFGARTEFVEPGRDHPAGTAARQCRRRAGHRQPALWHRLRPAGVVNLSSIASGGASGQLTQTAGFPLMSALTSLRLFLA